MKNKRILLVEDKYEDIIGIQNSLKSLNGQHTLHVVHNINDALQVLMGGSSHYGMENYSQTGKVRPDIVLLNISFLQQNAREFLEVMQKYYSLKNIKVYITGDSNESLDPQLALKYGIAGYLAKPLDFQNTVNESVVNFRTELQKPGKALFSVSLLALNNKFITTVNYLKAKCALYYIGSTVAAKVSVSLAVTAVAAGVITISHVDTSGQLARQMSRSSVYAPAPWVPVPAVQRAEQESIAESECIDSPEPCDEKMILPVTQKKTVIAQEPEPEKIATTEPVQAKEYKIVAKKYK